MPDVTNILIFFLYSYHQNFDNFYDVEWSFFTHFMVNCEFFSSLTYCNTGHAITYFKRAHYVRNSKFLFLPRHYADTSSRWIRRLLWDAHRNYEFTFVIYAPALRIVLLKISRRCLQKDKIFPFNLEFASCTRL